jgi:hypothetical protein
LWALNGGKVKGARVLVADLLECISMMLGEEQQQRKLERDMNGTESFAKVWLCWI